jgi:hypothetical protein
MDEILELYRRDIDVTLLESNLRLTIDQRFLRLMELQKFAEELRRAGEQHRLESR